MFHDIYLEGNAKIKIDYAVSNKRVEEIIEWHYNRGYQFVSIDSLFRNSLFSTRQCAITFDDGKENIRYVLPVLHKYNIPFCIYIITSKIGEENYLTEEQIKTLSKDPLCTIGSHTHTHPYTRYLKKNQLLEELIESKKCLENLLEKEVFHFAFPYGTVLACSFFDNKYVRKAGYKSSAFTLQIPLSPIKINPYYIPRFDASRKELLEVL